MFERIEDHFVAKQSEWHRTADRKIERTVEITIEANMVTAEGVRQSLCDVGQRRSEIDTIERLGIVDARLNRSERFHADRHFLKMRACRRIDLSGA